MSDLAIRSAPSRRNALVIGYGSIGQRHARVLTTLGAAVSVASRRPIDHRPSYPDIGAALAAQLFDYVVVANETSAHADAVRALIRSGYESTMLIEKPIVARRTDGEFPAGAPRLAAVAYNLRFHPLLQQLRAWSQERRCVAACLSVGQHLSTWRPNRDMRSTYSARAALGGGVLRDLSHELDYAQWLFGPWRRVAAVGGASGVLGIDADDHWSILLDCERCPQISITLSYLDHRPRRSATVIAADASATLDFLSGTLTTSDVIAPATASLSSDETYRRQHEALLAGDVGTACSIAEGYEVVGLIEAIEQAGRSGRWIARMEQR